MEMKSNKNYFTALIGLVVLITSCNSERNQRQQLDTVNTENMSTSELENIGFTKIKNPSLKP